MGEGGAGRPGPVERRGKDAAATVRQPSRRDRTLEELFAEERVPMLKVALLIVGHRDVAEDIVQEAFTQVSVRWAQLDNPGGYLRTCVVNGSLMAVRRRGVERRHQASPRRQSVEHPTHLVELHDALMALGEKQRTAIVLRYLLDLPAREIGELLGCSEATARSVVARGLGALRKELG
jgi:RNA polymerase sigma factor (sigma-70 family)